MISSQNSRHIFESGRSTVTSGGHLFNATSETVDQFVPGLLKIHPYEKLINTAVNWIESTDSISLYIYFVLVFNTGVVTATGVALLFHFFWFFKKSAFVNLPMTPILKVLNNEFALFVVSAVVLSALGIAGNYEGLFIGVVFFFLFKVGLLRRIMNYYATRFINGKLPLNDRVFKMVLIRYSLYENMPPPEVRELDEHVQDAVINRGKKKRKK